MTSKTYEHIADKFIQPQFVLCVLLVALFTWAYAENVSDETMKGSLIAAFSAAWGYYLGSSRGAMTQTENVGKALDLANTPTPKQVEVVNREDNPVPVVS